MRIRKLTLATLACLLLWTVTAAATPAQKEQALKVGKRGEITLTQPTKVGNIVLRPDTYVIQHRVSNGHHFVRFVELKQKEADVMGEETVPYTYTEADKAGEITCRVVPHLDRSRKRPHIL
jgi:hypothetical protein